MLTPMPLAVVRTAPHSPHRIWHNQGQRMQPAPPHFTTTSSKPPAIESATKQGVAGIKHVDYGLGVPLLARNSFRTQIPKFVVPRFRPYDAVDFIEIRLRPAQSLLLKFP